MRRTSVRLCALLAGAGLASSLVAAAPAAAKTTGPGDIATVAGGPGRGPALTVAQVAGSVAAGPAGDVYVGDSRGVVRGLTSGTSWETVTAGNATQNLLSGPRDGVAATVTPLDSVDGLAVDSARNVVISDGLDFLVWVVAARAGTLYGQAMKAGHIYSIAGTGNFGYSGDGGPATSAKLGRPAGLALDPSGNLLIADSLDSVARVVAARAGTFYGQAMKAGDIYTIAGTGTTGFSGDGGPATAAKLDGPFGPATDQAGNVVFADRLNQRVRVVASTSGTFYGQAMTAGHIYTIAGTGTSGYSGDGGPATAAALDVRAAPTVDSAGNVVFADDFNSVVRVVAAASGMFYGVAMKAGHIYTVAGTGQFGLSGSGGPATSAALESPQATAVDRSGNLLIADFDTNRIRLVPSRSGRFYGQAVKAGHIYTMAGNGTGGFRGDGYLATSAWLLSPVGVAVDPAGGVLIDDSGNQRIREVAG